MVATANTIPSQQRTVEEYTAINKANWNERAPLHARSPDYDVQRLLGDTKALSDVVTFDLPLLAEHVRGDVVHLQCHIGTDTLSLARLGADSVVGLDFSAEAVREAQGIACKAGLDEARLRFVESNVYDSVEALGSSRFDLVFTGIGALCWLPSIKKWARQVSGLLKSGGILFVREGHPVLWSIDDVNTVAAGLIVAYPYFEVSKPLETVCEESYVDTGDAKLQHNLSASWNHGIGEIISALLCEGMEIIGFVEHKSVPWCAIPGKMEKTTPLGEWVLTEGGDNVPLSFTLQARKK